MKLFYDGIDDPRLATLDGYSEGGGYEMLRKALSMQPQAVLQEMLDSEVRGYQVPDDNIIQDSVMSLAIGNAHADAPFGTGKVRPVQTW